MKTLRIPAVTGWSDLRKFKTGKIDKVNWPEAYAYCPDVRFAIAHDDERIYLRFEVTEANARAVCTVQNGPVWQDSCCEFFVKKPDSEFYYNFETNCIGVGLAAKRRSRSDSTPFSPEMMSKIVYRAKLGPEQINIGEQSSWYLEIEIPFELIGCDGCPERLLGNFYKCGDETDIPHFLSWNSISTPEPDFHRPEFFGELIFKK